jgi:MSHA biogenesis protein MshI
MIAASVRPPGRAGDKPKVLKCGQSSGVSMGVHALEEVAQKVSGTSRWTCPLARGDYQMLVLPEPPTHESEVEASLRWSLASMIDFPVDGAGVAWMRIPTAQFEPAHEKQVYAIVARDSVLDEQEALFKQAKLSLKAIDVRETALRNIAALLEKKGGEGLGLLTVGATGITTTFTFRGELYLDRFIAQDMDEVVNGDAERQQRFFDRVAQQVYQSMELITRSFPFISIGRIVVAPMPVPLGLAAYLAGKLPEPVESLNLDSVFDLSAVPELRKPENQARYLVALGAALRGMRASA